MGGILGPVDHRIKIHKITPPTGKERGDLEIKDYVVQETPQEQVDRLPPPRTLILDFSEFTLTHTCFRRSPCLSHRTVDTHKSFGRYS